VVAPRFVLWETGPTSPCSNVRPDFKRKTAGVGDDHPCILHMSIPGDWPTSQAALRPSARAGLSPAGWSPPNRQRHYQQQRQSYE
jgi:hypothetical protein